MNDWKNVECEIRMENIQLRDTRRQRQVFGGRGHRATRARTSRPSFVSSVPFHLLFHFWNKSTSSEGGEDTTLVFLLIRPSFGEAVISPYADRLYLYSAAENVEKFYAFECELKLDSKNKSRRHQHLWLVVVIRLSFIVLKFEYSPSSCHRVAFHSVTHRNLIVVHFSCFTPTSRQTLGFSSNFSFAHVTRS